MGHETSWVGGIVGEAAPSRHRVVETGPGIERDRATDSLLCLVGPSLGSRLEEERRHGAGIETRPGTSEEADRAAAGSTVAAPAPRRHGAWFSQRAVDPEADRIADPEGVRRALPSEPPLARAPVMRLELPGAGAPRDPARRGGHRALEAAHVAGNKKKLEDVAPTSHFSMKAASCSFRRAVERGARRGILQSSATATGTTASPRSRHSPWPPSALG